MEPNVLLGGLEELKVIKQKVMEFNQCTEQKASLGTQETQLEKSLEKKEREIADEIAQVTRQRRLQIESTIDKQVDHVTEKLKKVQASKEKSRKKAVVSRIDVETADFRNEAEELHLTGKSIFKQEHIPHVYNNRLFFALYFPRGLGDWGIIALTLAIVFFVIPFGLYQLLFDEKGVLYLALCYICTIIIFGGAYLILGKTKYKHQAALDRVREMRRRIQESKRKQKKIRRQIQKDKDDSPYDLESFDQEIQGLQQSINDLLQQKKAALSDFDTVTSQTIKEQILARHEEEVSSLKSEYRKVYDQNKENLECLNKLSLNLSSEYEGYLGKDFLTLDKLEQMEIIVTSGQANTIGEAMAALNAGTEKT